MKAKNIIFISVNLIFILFSGCNSPFIRSDPSTATEALNNKGAADIINSFLKGNY